MDSTLFKLGILEIRWYSLLILIAVITAYFFISKESKRKNLTQDNLMNIIFYGLIIGIIGARIYYVIFNFNYYLSNPLEIIEIWHGGLAIHGGILAGLCFIIIYTKKKNLNLLLTLDILVVGLIIAQSIGRWGNFFNQEAYGRIVSLSFLKNLHLPEFIINNMYIDGYYREPTFLYESILSLLGFITLLITRRKLKLKVGQVTGIYCIWYGIERLIIETFRSDSLMLGPIKIAQLISILFILTGLLLFIKNKNKLYKETKYE